uniref:Fzd-4-4 n=1 Tax=Dendrocoelum lacteum TaxID=27895 RepID=T1E1E8_9PLAT
MKSEKMILFYSIIFFSQLIFSLKSDNARYPRNVWDPIQTKKCQPKRIIVQECQHLFYNFTAMPNLINHETQIEAQTQLLTFQSLIKYKCSAKLLFFLCAVYIPMCDPNSHYLIGPCRPLCEEVRDSCEKIMKPFSLSWPVNLNCSRFPKSNTEGSMCMVGPGPSEKVEEVKVNCEKMKNPSSFVYINRTQKCVPKCMANILFNSDDKYIAKIWLAVLSSLCFISSMFTILTFLINTDRFKYPERPVIFLAVCYSLYSVSHFIRLLHNRKGSSCNRDPVTGQYILTQEGLENTMCAIIFLLNYFFAIASQIWWVILTLTWLLAAGFKWSEEAIYQRSGYFHLFAWLISSLLTVSVLVLRSVDADELLGLCSVGQQTASSLLIFVIIPNIIFLVIGCMFLLSGLIALVRVRRHVKNDGIKTDKLEILMVRIGLFSVLFLIPSSTVLACNIYEYVNKDFWLTSGTTPNIEIFMLKIFMASVVGITSGVWVWSIKTLDSWKWFFVVKLCRRQPSRSVIENKKNNFNKTIGYMPATSRENIALEANNNRNCWSGNMQKIPLQEFSSSGYTHPQTSSNGEYKTEINM